MKKFVKSEIEVKKDKNVVVPEIRSCNDLASTCCQVPK